MASPDVFRSSPMRPPRAEALVVGSSSPDLLPIQDLASQVPRRPTIRSGSKAQPIPDGANATFTSAKEHWKSAQAAAEKETAPIDVIDIAPEPAKKPRRPRTRKEPAKKEPVLKKKKSAEVDESIETSTTDQPWKKYKPSPKSKKSEDREESTATTAAATDDGKTTKRGRKKTGTMSSHFLGPTKSLPAEAPAKQTPDESLHLEQAANRRRDWTPPPLVEKVVPAAPSEEPTLHEVSSSAANEAGMFKSMLESFACNEDLSREAVVVSEEDSSFLKKRKLIEFVDTGEGSRSESPASETSPPKQKARKKKARTITDLATRAYRPATQVEETAPSASLLEHLSTVPEEGTTSDATKGKAKAQTRKKPVRKSKKKAPPPKPVLLSPGTALSEVSKQDFLFGTSSQLVREQSPSMLRDIQRAIRDSNAAEVINIETPLNSDAIEPFEPKQKLWEAAARDTDGQLFDAQIVDLVDESADSLVNDDDPFGYFRNDSEEKISAKNAKPPGDNSFETLSDILPSPKLPQSTQLQAGPLKAQPQVSVPVVIGGSDTLETLSDILPSSPKRTTQAIDEDAPFPSSQLSVSSDVQRQATSSANLSLSKAAEAAIPTPEASASVQAQPSRPKFELYTDVQLSKEITSYGFKPVKRRTAMISLLDQCWQSKTQTAPAGIRSISTSAAVSGSATGAKEASTSPKRPRGRPRRNSVIISESQEPPPSAQPIESPKRPRGRPRKNSATATAAVQSLSECQPSEQPEVSTKRPRGRPRKSSIDSSKTSPKKTSGKATSKASKASSSTRPRTPPRKPTIPRTVVEIPDSASENESDISASPVSSPEPTFSPPAGVDLSVSMEEDTELSFSVTPDDKEAALFNQITEAVTSTPRSTDPANPSWYEKMLMYDPIVLEDLTAWLNSGQLDRVGYDGEIPPGEVKKWCESKSICCLWKVNLRGKERKRL